MKIFLLATLALAAFGQEFGPPRLTSVIVAGTTNEINTNGTCTITTTGTCTLGVASAIPRVGKWTVANSGSNFLITQPDGTTSTVAKTAGVTQSVTLYALPVNAVLLGCTAKSTTAFTGTTTLTATAGVTGALTACVATPYDLKAAVGNTNVSVALALTPTVSIAGTNLILALTSTIDNLSSISAGGISVWVTWVTLP